MRLVQIFVVVCFASEQRDEDEDDANENNDQNGEENQEKKSIRGVERRCMMRLRLVILKVSESIVHMQTEIVELLDH